MSYAIDIYRGDARPIPNRLDFWCYVSMFAQLVAGPIVRFQDVADQLRERTHSIEKFARGLTFLSLGLMIGFMFPKNSDSPYCSQSITEFWRRWHISLSS